MIYDQNGNPLGDAQSGASSRPEYRPLGVTLWEILHPGQVQREAEAVGAPIPSYWDVWADNIAYIPEGLVHTAQRTADTTIGTASAATDKVTELVKWFAIAGIVYLAFDLSQKIPDARTVKTHARRAVKRARKRAARYVAGE